jgi:6,7-dimethyl-8-ribityllumazine synthase
MRAFAMQETAARRAGSARSMPYQTFRGTQDAKQLRVGILVSRFNEFITEALSNAALEVLEARGCPHENVIFVKVPGSFELASAAREMAPHCDCIVALGLQRVSLDTGVPIAFGVLTTDDMQQAMDRAGGKAGNKGAEAAETAIEMANLVKRLREPR